MVETRALRYRYAAGPELFFADIQLPQGATLLLRGNSGAGKSTWLALAAGLRTPTGGTVTVAGQALGGLSRAQCDRWRGRQLGFLPQRLHLSEALSVQSNLELAYFAAGLTVDRPGIARALETLDVAQLAQRRPSQLSGGQAQRVALARAILMAPKLILADEPTASLDDAAAATSLGLLRDCARQCNASLVIATHDHRVQHAFADALVYEIGAQPAWIGPEKL
ncbi:ABC transporter ATP-binding protein [uncultured Ramlibacter sp.]|uniref:ABC transporter ATP-binding protein n=1 Tax=uncultured Ramlibacter sp. TaxID=260755 RepID=UPI002639FCE3|nr:ATP-binding cassette domain-containing protein [uncultured Ramlibacter sp.]